MNSILITGNLTRDPDLQQTMSGVPVCNLTVACGRTYPEKEGGYKTDFFNVTCWRGLAESCARNLTKGSKVGVSGSMYMEEYHGKDGQKRVSYKVHAHEVEFIHIKRHDDEIAEYGNQAYAQTIEESELPF